MYSTCFWQIDKDLVRQDEFGKVKYKYSASNGIRKSAYVGFQEPIEIIPANTIVRLSLTRKFKSNGNDGFGFNFLDGMIACSVSNSNSSNIETTNDVLNT